MDAAVQERLQTVVLPNGKRVEISSTPQPWWDTDEHAGYIDPRLLAPDPDQPRQHMHDHDLSELNVTVGECGVREHIVVTPRNKAPWARVEPEDEDAYFVIVSGHRRRRSAIATHVQAVPIIIRLYKDRHEFRTDQLVLNASRSDLTPLEEGWYFAQLEAEGHNQSKIAKMVGASSPVYVADRIALTRLAPDIQELIAPKMRKHRKISLILASKLGKLEVPSVGEIDQLIEDGGVSDELRDVDFEELGDRIADGDEDAGDELRFHFQRLMLHQAQTHSRSSQGMQEFVHNRMMRLGSYKAGHHARGERFVPKNKWRQLMTFVDSLSELLCFTWSIDDWRRILYNRRNKDVREVVVSLREGAANLAQLADTLEGIVAARGEDKESVIDTMIRVSYIDSEGMRRDNNLVTREQFVRLWHDGKLLFQVNREEKPDDVPDVKEVERLIES